MIKANNDIRAELKAANLTLWQIGIMLGVNEVTMCRRLRLELSESEKAEIRDVMKKISEVKNNATDENY